MSKMLWTAATALLFSACGVSNNPGTATGTSQETKEERNKQTALASAAAVNDADAFFKDAAPDFIEYGEGSFPPVRSVDSAKAGHRMLITAIPDFKGSELMAVADGDYVMVYGTWSGTWKADLMGMKASGKSFTIKDVDIYKFNEAGKITEHRSVHPLSNIGRLLDMPMPNQ